MARLVFKAGVLSGRSLDLPPGKTLVVGRARDADLCVPDIKLSRRHCRFESALTSFVVRDMGSTNGTYVNGQRVQEAVLGRGDQVAFGDTVVDFVADDAVTDIGTQVGSPAALAGTAAAPLEIDLPLPPLPEEKAGAARGAAAVRKSSAAGLTFCDGCDVSIPALDIDIGLATDVNGKLLCKDCVAKESGPKAGAGAARKAGGQGVAVELPSDGLAALEKVASAREAADLPGLLEDIEDTGGAGDLDLLKPIGTPSSAADAAPAAAMPPSAVRRKADTLSQLKAQLMAEARGDGAPAPTARRATPGGQTTQAMANQATAASHPAVPVQGPEAPASREASPAEPKVQDEDLVPLGEIPAPPASDAPPAAGKPAHVEAPPPAPVAPATAQAAAAAPAAEAKMDEDLVPLAEILPPGASAPAAPPAPVAAVSSQPAPDPPVPPAAPTPAPAATSAPAPAQVPAEEEILSGDDLEVVGDDQMVEPGAMGEEELEVLDPIEEPPDPKGAAEQKGGPGSEGPRSPDASAAKKEKGGDGRAASGSEKEPG